MLCVMSSIVFAQLKVTSDGKVGIGITQTPVSKFAVGTIGDSNTPFVFDGVGITTMAIKGSGGNSNGYGTALYVSAKMSSSNGYRGIQSDVSTDIPNYSGRAIGISSITGNAANGYNYGVIGALNGNRFGTGILGTTVVSSYLGTYIDGMYAGYFQGNVKVTGTINGTLIGNSDIRFKQNITDLGSTDKKNGEVLKRITSLVPISYNYKQVYYDLKQDSNEINTGYFDEKSQLFQKKHYGLIAQDLQEIYPDLVYENDNGYLSINYTEIIPLLIQSIKELKEEVDLLTIASLSTRSTTSTHFIDDLSRAILYQNTPNPFSERTVIKYELPQNIGNASIMIFNMQGSLIKQVQVNNYQSSITINGSELTAGMYLYSLIVDGREVDTKRMILTK